MAIIIFLLILSFLVIIHELGHFITARWMKIRIEEFGIGYPPKALTLFHWKGIPFTLNWLPFGGFVKMEGEDGDSGQETGDSKQGTVASRQEKAQQSTADQESPFYAKSKRARLFVLLAGVVVNFVFGVLAFAVVYARVGIPTPLMQPVISAVEEGSPAAESGFQIGDTVVAIMEDERNEIDNINEFVSHIKANQGKDTTFIINRASAEQTLSVYVRTPEETPSGSGAIGIGFETLEMRFYPTWQMPFRGMWVGLQQSIGLSWMIVQAFVDIFVKLFTTAQVPQDVAGPIGIVHQASRTGLFEEGWMTILNFSAMLSINLAILNVLPIPALDGGRAMFVLLETVIGKNRRSQIESRANYLGFGLLLVLIIVISLRDIWVVIKDVVL